MTVQSVAYNSKNAEWSVHMAEKKQSLSMDDVEGVAGGTVDVSVDKTRLRKIVVDAKGSGKTLDWALEYCDTEEEREFVRYIWNGLS